MAANKAAKTMNRPSNRHPTPPPQLASTYAQPDPATNGKKKKKKKGKARGFDQSGQGNQSDDDLPQLEPVNAPPQAVPSPRRTGLSPELESVHLSTTASLSASAAAAARLNATAQAQAELLATANDLYRRMDADSLPDDDDYWSKLPAHIKNFVRMTYSQSNSTNVSASDRAKVQNMYAFAQQMIQSGATKGGQPPGAFPSSLSFDPSLFTDPAFSDAMEKTLAAAAPLPPAPGQPPRGPLPPTNVMLLNEFGGADDQQHLDEEYYSEDEVDENVDDHGSLFPGYNHGSYPSQQEGKKKSKKKKKKGGAAATLAQTPNIPPPAPAPVTNPAPAARPQPTGATHTSARAQGKLPMSYSATQPPPAAPPSRTSRTVTKAPLSSHYHHSSPASSQTSHKAAAPPSNNKLWSTNSTEERERIKEFWLGLGEEERRALVKVEKEAVLKKMKEQQKHSCSCAVCGRKRYVIITFCSVFAN